MKHPYTFSTIVFTHEHFGEKYRFSYRSDLHLPDLTPWSARLGLPLNCPDIEQHIHLIFLIAICKNREAGICSFNYLKNKILFTRKIELNLKYNSVKQRSFSSNKWSKITRQTKKNLHTNRHFLTMIGSKFVPSLLCAYGGVGNLCVALSALVCVCVCVCVCVYVCVCVCEWVSGLCFYFILVPVCKQSIIFSVY